MSCINVQIKEGDVLRNFIPSFSLPPLLYKNLPSLVLYLCNPPFFSSILYLSPSASVKHNLFSNIHLSFLILFYVFPILDYLFLFLSSTFEPSLSSFTIFFLPSILDPLLCMLKFYPLTFADHTLFCLMTSFFASHVLHC